MAHRSTATRTSGGSFRVLVLGEHLRNTVNLGRRSNRGVSERKATNRCRGPDIAVHQCGRHVRTSAMLSNPRVMSSGGKSLAASTSIASRIPNGIGILRPIQAMKRRPPGLRMAGCCAVE